LRLPGTTTEQATHDADLLMAQVKRGSVEAFEELYDRYCGRALQGGTVNLWRPRTHGGRRPRGIPLHLEQSHGLPVQRGTVAAWLLTTVRHRAIDVARRDHTHAGRRAADHSLAPHTSSGAPADQVTNRQEAPRRLRTQLTRLPEAQRDVITLAFYGELTHTEIPQRSDCLPGPSGAACASACTNSAHVSQRTPLR
jgi:RNA polymerase sigma-70 factor, ECF subfamily